MLLCLATCTKSGRHTNKNTFEDINIYVSDKNKNEETLRVDLTLMKKGQSGLQTNDEKMDSFHIPSS